MPLPTNDPRRRKDPRPTLPSGSKPGVGYRLLLGAKTFRGSLINQDVHPFGTTGARMGSKEQVLCPVEKASERWPLFDMGFNLKISDQYLRGLWEARQIPGLEVEDHDDFDGIPTAEEWHDLAMTEDHRVIAAWANLNKTAPFDPKDFDIGAAFNSLGKEQREAVRTIIVGMLRK